MKSSAPQVALVAIVASVITTLLVEPFRGSPRSSERSAAGAGVPAKPVSREPGGAVPSGPAEDERLAADEALADLRERVVVLEQGLARQEIARNPRLPLGASQLPANREALRDFVLEVMTTDTAERAEARLVEEEEEERRRLALNIRMQGRETEGIDLLDHEVEAIVDIVMDIEQRRAELQALAGSETADLETLERDFNDLEGEMRRRVEQQIGVHRTRALLGEG